MKKNDLKEASLDRPANVQIVLSQYKEFDHEGWECDIFHKDEYIGGGTAPTKEAVYDLAQEIIYDYENPSLW